jgi:hypothetical protein
MLEPRWDRRTDFPSAEANVSASELDVAAAELIERE